MKKLQVCLVKFSVQYMAGGQIAKWTQPMHSVNQAMKHSVLLFLEIL